MRNLLEKGLVLGILFLFAGASFLQQIQPTVKADLTDGLIGYWSFNEESGTILHDNSGNGYDGTIDGATWTTGILGGALSFDGINDYIQFSSPVLNIPSYSVCAWVKASSLPGPSTAHIIGNGGVTQNSYGFYLMIEYANNWQFGATIEGGNQLQWADSPASTGDWYFLVGTWDGSPESNHLKLYVNGAPIGTYVIVQPWSTGSANNLRMGAPTDQLNYLYNGILDEVRIYNRVLTEDEIQELFVPSTVYVDDDFNSSTPGWGYDHFSSIQDGIDAVDVGGTVFVSSGTYIESLWITKSNISLQGESKQTTIINADGTYESMGAVYTEITHSVFISGFTLRGINAPCVYFRDSIDGLIFDCILKDSTYGGVIYTENNGINNTIRDCEIYNNNVGIGLSGGDNNYYLNRNNILSCYIHDNVIGISIHGRLDYSGIINHTSIIGCNIFNNTEKSIFINQLLGEIIGATIYHNNIFNNAGNAYDNGTNEWYNITLHEGNYWDDYTGEDNNHDGIGDTPYNISGGNNKDLYPLMNQYGSENNLPVANAGGPYYANVGNSITFNGSGSSDTDGTIVGYRWDWTNDGTYDTDWLTSATTTHSYPSAGSYTVNLQVKDNAGGTDTDTATAYITTEGGAAPTAEANGPYSGYVNHPVFFSSAGSVGGSEGTITQWYWTFGDGVVSSQQNPSHTYTSAGTFTVILKVTNNFGQTNIDTTSATINELSPDQILPVANAGGPYSGVVDSPITFNGSGSTDADGTIVSYVWNFGDSTTGTGVSPTHIYTIPGNYTVILTVTDNESLTHSDSTTADINVSGPPTIVISVDISNIEPIEEENEKTIPVTVFCYHQTVSNIRLEILEDSNLNVTFLSPNITLNPGESRELLINVKAPKLEIKGNDKVGDETIILRAVGDDNVTSNTEQINIKVVEKGATPGFELVFVLCAIGVALFLWRKKRRV